MNTISSDISGLLPKAGSFGTPLTEEQKSTVEGVLSQYDADSLSEEDAQSIKQELNSAGIQPSRELGAFIEEAGFDSGLAKPPGGPGGPNGAGGPPGGQAGGPPPGQGGPGQSEDLISQEGLQALTTILEGFDLENLDEDDITSIQDQLAEAGFLGQGSVVNLGA